MHHYAIAIDGPAGSGKSTVAKALAKKLNIVYVDTGAMYRAVGLYCRRKGISLEKEEQVAACLEEIQLKLEQDKNGQKIFLNGEDVTESVRTPEAGKGASMVAGILSVREYLVKIQREMAQNRSVVMDGRDIGTNVLPKAEIKIYLTASVEERTKRRCGELREKGGNPDFETVCQQISERDRNDMNRKHNPLKKAEDALELDTTGMSIEESANRILDIVKEKIPERE